MSRKMPQHYAIVTTVLLLFAGCGREVLDLSKAGDSYQCQYMKDVCRESQDYEATFAKMSAEDKKEMKTILDTYHNQCSNAIRACNESTLKK